MIEIKEDSYLSVAYVLWKISHFYHGIRKIKDNRAISAWYWLFLAAERGEI
jgi:hypothetical protein